MTVQMSDSIQWNDKSYKVTNKDPHPIFSPQSIGVTPVPFATCCWAGYVGHYAIKEDELFLKSMSIGLENHNSPPVINGIAPNDLGDCEFYFGHHYENIWLPLNYSGKLILGNDWVGNLGRGHHGYAQDVEFEEVQSCIFEQGKLINVTDLSDQCAKERAVLVEKLNAERAEYLQKEEKRKRRKRMWFRIKSFFTGRRKPMATPED